MRVNLGLDGKLCVVTGATRGIGAATVRMLKQEGAQVVAVARKDADLELDVTTTDAGDRVLAACPQPPWALINAAGDAKARPLDELTDADWQAHWDLHVMGPMRLMRALAPAMAESGGGRIVNVSSSSGKRPSRRLDASYSVTKAALLSLSRLFADTWSANGVLVNAVAPGPIAGESWTAAGGLADEIAERTQGTREDVLEATGSGLSIGRMGTDDEAAAVIVFLCSELASNVTGAAWSVDGGSVPIIL
jgi:NAD(P)-dependent dehydrogenase (short-subunit alcohol dehydrogenase family)